MAAPSGQQKSIRVPLLDRLTWSDTVLPLDLVLEQFRLPQIVKLAGGNVPDFPEGAIVLLVGLRQRNSRYVVARCMAGDKDRTMVGPWMSVPFSCQTKFVRMSDQQANKDRFQGAKQLAQCLPSKVIATEAVAGSQSSSRNLLVNTGEEIRCLGIEGVHAKMSGNRQHNVSPSWTLACLNENDEYVTLPLACSATFLAVAGGVVRQNASEETVDKLASDTLPLTVLQTDGETPKFCQDTFTGIFRLVQARDERMIFACSLRPGANGAILYEFLEIPAWNKLAVTLADGMLKDQVSYNMLLMECCEKLDIWKARDKDTGRITRVLTHELYFKNKAPGRPLTQRLSLLTSPAIQTEEDDGLYALPQSYPHDHRRPPTPPPLESLFALRHARNRALSVGDASRLRSGESMSTAVGLSPSTRLSRSAGHTHRRHSNDANIGRRHSQQNASRDLSGNP